MEDPSLTNPPQGGGVLVTPQLGSPLAPDPSTALESASQPVQTEAVTEPQAQPSESKITKSLVLFVLAILGGIVVLSIGLYLAVTHGVQKTPSAVGATYPIQSVEVSSAQNLDQPFLLQGTAASQLQLSGTNGATVLSFASPTQNNKITVPNASGTVCLDTNNCSYVTSANLQSTVAGVQAVVTGSVNSVAAAETSLASKAILQGGNAFGAAAILGTTDNQPVRIGTDGQDRLTVAANGQVGIGNITPSYPLDVVGDINTSTELRIAGNAVCTASGCVAQAGSSAYIQNNTGGAQQGNINVQASTAGSVAATLQANSNGSGDILDLQSGSGQNVASFGGTGSVAFQNSTNSTTAFQVQNASGVDVFDVSTTNNRVAVDAAFTPMASPGALTLSTDTSGGTLTAGTYYYVVSALDAAGGETTPSPEASITTTGSTSTVTISWTAIPGASGYRIYRGTTSGGENEYYNSIGTLSGTTISYTDNGSVNTYVGAHPATTTTAYISTNNASNNTQLVVGGNGTPTGQLYVSGVVPTAYLGAVNANLGYPKGVVAQGNYIYVIDNNGFHIFDVSNPISPTSIGYLTLPTTPNSGFAVAGHYAYIGDASNPANLYVVDVSDPSDPTLVSTTKTGLNQINAVDAQGQYLYVISSGSNRLVSYNINNPLNPVSLGVITVGTAVDFAVQGNYAYVADKSAGQFVVINVSNPASPVQVGVATISSVNTMVVAGRYAYVAGGSNGFNILDISNPASPVLVSSTNLGLTSGTTTVYAIQGRYLYVTDRLGGALVVVDVSNPNDPFLVGKTKGVALLNGLAVDGRYAYGTGQFASLVTFDLGGEYAQQLQAGGAEVGTLTVDTDETVAGDSNIQGSLNVGGDAAVSGDLGISGNASIQGSLSVAGGVSGGIVVNGLTIPGAPILKRIGTAGTTHYSYAVSAVTATGGVTLPSPVSTVTNGNATLSTTNYITVTWSAVPGAVSYNVYRTASGGTPSSTGLIGNVYLSSFSDTGIAATTPVPTTDTSGQLTVNGNGLFQNTSNSTQAFQIENASGSSILTVDTQNSIVKVNGAITANHFIGGSGAPTITGGSGAGGTPTVAVSGSDAAGQITLTTGSSPSASSVIVTLTFNSAYDSAPYVVFSPANANAAALSGSSNVYTNSTTSNFTLNSGSTGLTAGTQYTWTYHVIQ